MTRDIIPTANLYVFAESNPGNLVDPSGIQSAVYQECYNRTQYKNITKEKRR